MMNTFLGIVCWIVAPLVLTLILWDLVAGRLKSLWRRLFPPELHPGEEIFRAIRIDAQCGKKELHLPYHQWRDLMDYLDEKECLLPREGNDTLVIYGVKVKSQGLPLAMDERLDQ